MSKSGSLYRLCDHYNLSADYILFGNQRSSGSQPTPTAPDMLVQLANSLTIRELDSVIQYLNSLRKIKELHL